MAKVKGKSDVQKYLESLVTLQPDSQKTLVRWLILNRAISLPSSKMLKEVGLTTSDIYKQKLYSVSVNANKEHKEKYRDMLTIALVNLGLRTWSLPNPDSIVFETPHVLEVRHK